MYAAKTPKAQAAMEYMSVVGIALLLLTPIILISERSVKEMNDNSNVLLAREALNKIVNAAEVVHSQGPPSTMTIEAQFPHKMIQTVVSNQMILIEMPTGKASSDIVSVMDFNVTGALPTSAGTYRVRIEAMYDTASISNAVNITAIS